jgi:hypothetical protein
MNTKHRFFQMTGREPGTDRESDDFAHAPQPRAVQACDRRDGKGDAGDAKTVRLLLLTLGHTCCDGGTPQRASESRL